MPMMGMMGLPMLTSALGLNQYIGQIPVVGGAFEGILNTLGGGGGLGGLGSMFGLGGGSAGGMDTTTMLMIGGGVALLVLVLVIK